MDIIWKGAHENNYMEGRDGEKIDKIIIHWTSGTLGGTDAWFNNPDSGVSAHYGIGGKIIHQYVKEEDTAFAAGNWEANKTSVNIEHEGSPTIPIDFETYKTSAQVIREIASRYDIPIDKEHIRPHSDFTATQCPGEFDIERLIDLALGYEDDQDKIARLENEVIELTAQRDRKDRKLETCREERAEYKAETVEIREQYQKQVAELNQTNASLSNEVRRLATEIETKDGRIQTLESSESSLKEGLEAVEKKLQKEHQKYTDLEEKYTKERENTQNLIKNISILEFIWRKWVG